MAATTIRRQNPQRITARKGSHSVISVPRTIADKINTLHPQSESSQINAFFVANRMNPLNILVFYFAHFPGVPTTGTRTSYHLSS